MDVHLKPELESKLSRLASSQGRDAATLVEEAVQRLIDYEEWFVQEVEKGISAADRGELVDHASIRQLIDRRYPG